MEDMIRMGWTGFRLARDKYPLSPDVWQCESAPKNTNEIS